MTSLEATLWVALGTGIVASTIGAGAMSLSESKNRELRELSPPTLALAGAVASVCVISLLKAVLIYFGM